MLRNLISNVRKEFLWQTSLECYRERVRNSLQHHANEISNYISLLKDGFDEENLREIERYLFDHLPGIIKDYRIEIPDRFYSPLEAEVIKLRRVYVERSASYLSKVEN